MRILITNYRDIKHPQAGGAEVHLHRIFGRLVALGHPVMLFTTSFPGALEREIIDGIQVVRCGSDGMFQWNVWRHLRRLEKEFQPHIIVEDLNKLPVGVNQLTKTPKLIQIHHLWGFSIFKEAFFPIALGVWLAEKAIPFFYKNCHFVSVSPSTHRELLALGIPAHNASIIYNGTEDEFLGLEPCREKKPYFLWLGRIRRYKGIWVALEAFREFATQDPHTELWIAGGGPEQEAVQKAVQKWGLTQRVKLLGRVNAEQKRTLMRESLALLQTSFKEGWGLTVIEAAACGSTSIASRVPGLCDSIVDQETGLLFPAGDSKACAALMKQLATNTAMRKNLESAAHTWAQKFNWDRSAQETLELLQKISGSH